MTSAALSVFEVFLAFLQKAPSGAVRRENQASGRSIIVLLSTSTFPAQRVAECSDQAGMNRRLRDRFDLGSP